MHDHEHPPHPIMWVLPLPFCVQRTPNRSGRRGCGRRGDLLQRYLVVRVEEFHAVPGPLVDVVFQERQNPVGEVQTDVFVPVLSKQRSETQQQGDAVSTTGQRGVYVLTKREAKEFQVASKAERRLSRRVAGDS